jgi:lipoate-protein ligase B
MIDVVNLGLTRYEDAWRLQRRLFDLRSKGLINDVLLLNEHRHVYTLGRSADPNHLLANEPELRTLGIDVCSIERGGDVTYHGPGQIVGYPILDLNAYQPDIHRYLRNLEELIIRALAVFGIAGRRDDDFTGVWAGRDKIAAIGVRVSRWITMHGFALNVNTDLDYFQRIIPCGIFHRGVTSMRVQLGREVAMESVCRELVTQVGAVFGTDTVLREAKEYTDSLPHASQEKAECPP